MFERPKGGERCLLAQITLPGIDADLAFEEFSELARSAELCILGTIRGSRAFADPKYFIGSGKLEEIKTQVETLEIELVIFNHELSPSQERNLEKALSCRVVDRSALILDIFAQRARTFEGKLQVELAQLEHLSTRLIRGWANLGRQKGGIGLRGPGETQLETDRRLIRVRIKTIQGRLAKLRQSREQNRRARKKSSLPVISLVGYTNSGKSTLFNALTGEAMYAADLLFATLDTTIRKLDLPGTQGAILVDTVGFIRDLPHQLVDAFRATLEETSSADLLLQVIDYADPNWRSQHETVEAVLTELGADTLRSIKVFNKIDLSSNQEPYIEWKADQAQVFISAKEHKGLDLLKIAIGQSLHGLYLREEILLQPEQAKLRAKFYALGAVLHEEALDEGGWRLLLHLSPAEKKRLLPK